MDDKLLEVIEDKLRTIESLKEEQRKIRDKIEKTESALKKDEAKYVVAFSKEVKKGLSALKSKDSSDSLKIEEEIRRQYETIGILKKKMPFKYYDLETLEEKILSQMTSYYFKHGMVESYAKLLKIRSKDCIKADEEIIEKFTEKLEESSLTFKPQYTFDFDKYMVKFIDLCAKKDIGEEKIQEILIGVVSRQLGPVIEYVYASDKVDRMCFEYSSLKRFYDKQVKKYKEVKMDR